MSQTTHYHVLKSKIISGKLRPGERLTEARAAKILGAGRGPARESLVRLEAEGLVGRRGPGAIRYVGYVEDYSSDELRLQYELREVIDGLAARCAALNMTGRAIMVLRESVEAIALNIAEENSKMRVNALHKFYTTLRSKCGNPLVMQACQGARIHTLHVCDRELDQKLLAKIPYSIWPIPSLESVVDAIADHEPDLAETEMRKWTRAAREIICGND